MCFLIIEVKTQRRYFILLCPSGVVTSLHLFQVELENLRVSHFVLHSVTFFSLSKHALDVFKSARLKEVPGVLNFLVLLGF